MTVYSRRGCMKAVAVCLGAVAQATVLSFPAAAAGLFLQGFGFGGTVVTMNVQSFQEKKYSATIAQQYDFSCGSAALATLLTYNYDIKADEQEIFKDMFEKGDKEVISKSGFSLLDIKNYLARRGIESDGYQAPLEKLAAVRVPAIVLVNVRGYSHFVVLQSIRDGWVLLADPANGLRSEPLGEFQRHWSGVFFLVLTNAEKAQQHFVDDRRWSAAPEPPWELARYAIDLTNLARPAMLGLGRF
jgi:uncharacterized protein